MATNQQKNQHLLWRAGFGPAAAEWENVQDRSTSELWASLRNESEPEPAYFNVLNEELENSYRDPMLMRIADEITKKRLQELNRNAMRDINLRWMSEMTQSKAQLREKMAFFWHGHFPTYTQNVRNAQELLHVIRTHALGNFRTLLKGVSQSGAMMLYLNAQQNRKTHPNENFAREVMELFTLGRGNYTEKDIQEAARAFTGWHLNTDGTFSFLPKEHDASSKTILGHIGVWKGDDVLGFLLERKETARHITRKLYKFLVSDTPDEIRVAQLAEIFYKNDYEIMPLLEAIFTSGWFYDQTLFGARIKSPVELLVGIRRTLPLKLENEEYFLVLQRALGQILFFPPNVAGWPGGRTWIDSNTLPTRMRLPHMLQEIKTATSASEIPVLGGVYSNAKVRALGKNTIIRTQIDWNPFLQRFEGLKREELTEALGKALLAIKMQVPSSLVTGAADATSRDTFLRTATLQVMGLPEYQLC